ncbi:MAG: 3-hydroxyacyl-ACP dehydratase FabZ [Elusimicrobia bacterium]|nr:3-hydroxyacyl-ACP dehydratase FabZ [Elusimicrobiota bacterium]
MTPTTETTPSAVRELNIQAIREAIPHRWPFLLVDRVRIIEEGKKAYGYKYVTFNETFFQGHFPQRPVMPGVLIVEALAQTACALMLGAPQMAGKLAYFMGIEQAKFRQPVFPGCYLELRIDVLRAGSRAGKAKGEAYIDGQQLACEAEFTFALVDK